MSVAFLSKRSSLEPVATALNAAVGNYVQRREDQSNAVSALAEARRRNSIDIGLFADAVDRTTEALSDAGEQVSELMAELKQSGALDGFLAFVSSQKRPVQ